MTAAGLPVGTENSLPPGLEVELMGRTWVPGLVHAEQGQGWVSALAAQPLQKAPALVRTRPGFRLSPKHVCPASKLQL